MHDLFRMMGSCQTSPERAWHFPSVTTIELRCEATAKVLLPACPQNRISVTGVAEFELDEAVEDRLAFAWACGMAIAARGGEEQHKRNPAYGVHVRSYRKKWTRMGGD